MTKLSPDVRHLRIVVYFGTFALLTQGQIDQVDCELILSQIEAEDLRAEGSYLPYTEEVKRDLIYLWVQGNPELSGDQVIEERRDMLAFFETLPLRLAGSGEQPIQQLVDAIMNESKRF